MKILLPRRRKTRADSVIDTRLNAEQSADLAARLDGGLSIADAARELLDAHGIQLSRVSVSRWAAKRRRAQSDLTFARLLEGAAADQERAASLGDAETLTEANLVLLNRALFAALCSGDQPATMRAAQTLNQVLAAVAKGRRARAAILKAEQDAPTSRDDA